MTPPYEIDSHKVLPTIRRGLTKILMEEAGKNQTEVSEILGVSQATVSHYSSDKRGRATLIDRDPDIQKKIRALGEDLTNGISTSARIDRMWVICKRFRTHVLDEHDRQS
ncbi:MAG: transcriptional regulator [Thermoplasmata archaeon]